MPDRWWDAELYAGLGLGLDAEPFGTGGGASRFERGNLRIAHVCKFFPPERGGMETYVRDLAQEQAAAGHQVTVLAHTASASRWERMPEGYTISRSRVWMRAGDYVPVAPGLAWQVWRALRGGNLDILHVHCPNPAALWCVLLAGRAGLSAGAGQGCSKNAASSEMQERGANANACASHECDKKEVFSVSRECGNDANTVTAYACGKDSNPYVPEKYSENVNACASQGAAMPSAAPLPKIVVHWHSDVIFPQDRQPNAVALALWRRMERALLARADRIIATSQPYLESSEFLAPWRGKCVVAPLRLSATRPKVPTGLRHPALDFLRGAAGAAQRLAVVRCEESVALQDVRQNYAPASAADLARGGASVNALPLAENILHEPAGEATRSAHGDQRQQNCSHGLAGEATRSAHGDQRQQNCSHGLAGEASRAAHGDQRQQNCSHGLAGEATRAAHGDQRQQNCSHGLAGEATRSVLAVGRLAHYKGFDVLIRAVAVTPSLRCCIIGAGEEGPKLRALVQELGVQDRVLLPGEVDDDVLAACYEACDVFCLPSLMRTEAFGVVLLEALRAGKWCVVSDVPGSGMGTVIRHGENGWLVPPGDVAELVKRLMISKIEYNYCS